jgi:hypothetical protein
MNYTVCPKEINIALYTLRGLISHTYYSSATLRITVLKKLCKRGTRVTLGVGVLAQQVTMPKHAKSGLWAEIWTRFYLVPRPMHVRRR